MNMHPEEQKRQNVKWAIIHCPLDQVRKTNIPTTIISPLYDTYNEAEVEFKKRLPNKKEDDYEYGVLKTDGTDIY